MGYLKYQLSAGNGFTEEWHLINRAQHTSVPADWLSQIVHKSSASHNELHLIRRLTNVQHFNSGI